MDWNYEWKHILQIPIYNELVRISDKKLGEFIASRLWLVQNDITTILVKWYISLVTYVSPNKKLTYKENYTDLDKIRANKTTLFSYEVCESLEIT